MEDARPAAGQAGSPFRHPDWRWRRAAAVVAAGKRCSKATDDPATFDLAAFARAAAKGRTAAGDRRLAASWPGLPEAAAVHAGPPLRRAEVEARLLAGQSDADVAARTGLPAAAVAWYAAAYFDVRPRLSARDWIAFRAIGVSAGGGLPAGDVGPLLKTAGYHGGPVVLDLVKDGYGRPTNPAVNVLIEQLHAAHLRGLRLHADAAATQDAERVKVLSTAAARLHAELRRTAVVIDELLRKAPAGKRLKIAKTG